MNNIELYKKISKDIISSIENDNLELVEELLKKRQHILNDEAGNTQFKEILKEDGIIEVDNEIHNLLTKSILDVKLEIKKHKQLIQANNSYTNSFRENLNIFYKKV